MRFPRLLGDDKLIVTDDNRNEWLLAVDFKCNGVFLWRNEDCITKEGTILSNVTKYLGMHKIIKQIRFEKQKILCLSAKKLKKNYKIHRFSLPSAPPAITKLRLVKIGFNFLEQTRNNDVNIDIDEVKVETQLSMITMINRL